MFPSSRRAWRRSLVWGLAGLLPAAAAAALEARLLLPDGTPAAGFQVAIMGHPGSVVTDTAGVFRVFPDPPLPFVLLATSPAGEVHPPLEVQEAPAGAELQLPATFRESVTVAAGVAPTIEAPPAAGAVLLAAEDLEQRRPQHLADALQGVAGASRLGEGPDAVPVLRSLARGRTLILVDGARVTTERRAGPSATFLDPFSLATIEIARGPGSVTYGSDAFGGVVNARSRDPEPGPWRLRYDLNRWWGGSDQWSAGAEASGGVGRGALLVAAHARAGDDGEAGGGEPVANSAYRDGGGALRWAGDLPWGRLRLGLAVDEARDVGKPASDSAVVRAFYPRETSRRFTLGLAGDRLPGFESFEVQGFLGGYRLVLDRDRLATEALPRLVERSDVDARDASLRAVAARLAGGGRLQIGVETVARFGLEASTERELYDDDGALVERERTTSIADARRLDVGLFSAYERPLAARLSLGGGLRADRVEARNRGGHFGDRDAAHGALSGHFALVAGPFAGVTSTLQVARGFRDPLLSDRYFRGPSGRGFVTGNPDLEPEESRQLDAALRWARRGASVAVYGYRYRIADLVERYREGGDFFFRNRGAAELSGVELEARCPLGGGLTLELAAAAAHGETRDDGSAVDDVAPRGGLVTLRWAGESGFAFLRAGAYARHDRPGPTEVARPGFTTWDLGAGWRLHPRLELRLITRNLTDRRFAESPDETAALAAGRSLAVGLAGRW